MLSVNEGLTAAQVKFILEATADKIGTGVARVGIQTATIPAGFQAAYAAGTGHDTKYGFGRVNAERAVKVARGDPLPQVVQPVGGAKAQADEVVVLLRRRPGTNQFVSVDELEVVDARRDPEQDSPVIRSDASTPPGVLKVRGGRGGFLRASFQPAGGGPAISDELTVREGV
jgi:hypothetical protein